MQLEAREARVAGRRVRYRAAGAGPPLVLVHGLAGSWRWWRPALPALAERHAVYAVDLPGFGELRGQRFSLETAPDFLCDWLHGVGLQTASLAGYSMGGAVCAAAAARSPERIERLVLVAPAIGLRRSLLGHALPLLRTVAGLSPRFVPTLALDALRCGPLGLARAGLAVVAGTGDEELGAVRAPTLIVWGERDLVVPPETAESLARRLPDARTHVIAGAGHVPMVDAPDEFARAVLDHLRA